MYLKHAPLFADSASSYILHTPPHTATAVPVHHTPAFKANASKVRGFVLSCNRHIGERIFQIYDGPGSLNEGVEDNP